MKSVIHFIHEGLKTQRGEGNYTKSGTGNTIVNFRHIRNLLNLAEITGAWLLSLDLLILKEILEPQASQPQGNNGARYNIILSIIYFVNICYYVSNMQTWWPVLGCTLKIQCLRGTVPQMPTDSKPLMENAQARTAINAWEENESQ